MFEQFRNDFWTKQHHWYTAMTITNDEVNMFTVPCRAYSRLTLTFGTELHYNHSLIDKSKLFDNVTDLIISSNALVKRTDFKFSNIK